jgi:hypothetical protein
MKRKLNDTQEASPNKKQKTANNYQKMKDLKVGANENAAKFDQQIRDLVSKVRSLQQEKIDFNKSYYLDNLDKKNIDYLFCNNDKNIDTNKFKVIKINYKLFYNGDFTGGTVMTCQNELLMNHKITSLELKSEVDKDIRKYVNLDDYEELLKVSAIREDEEDEEFRKLIQADAKNRNFMKEVKSKDYYITGYVTVKGFFERAYYFVQKK